MSYRANNLKPFLLVTFAILCVAGLISCAGTPAALVDNNAVLDLMLTSHENWSSLRGETLTIWHSSGSEEQRVVNRFTIANPDHAKFEMLELGTILLADGQTVYESYDQGETFAQFKQQDANRLLEMLPASVDEVSRGEVYLHPIAMSISSPVVDYIFPVGLAQGLGAYQIIGQESVIGRKTWVVTLELKTETGEITMRAKY